MVGHLVPCETSSIEAQRYFLFSSHTHCMRPMQCTNAMEWNTCAVHFQRRDIILSFSCSVMKLLCNAHHNSCLVGSMGLVAAGASNHAFHPCLPSTATPVPVLTDPSIVARTCVGPSNCQPFSAIFSDPRDQAGFQ